MKLKTVVENDLSPKELGIALARDTSAQEFAEIWTHFAAELNKMDDLNRSERLDAFAGQLASKQLAERTLKNLIAKINYYEVLTGEV